MLKTVKTIKSCKTTPFAMFIISCCGEIRDFRSLPPLFFHIVLTLKVMNT